MSASPHLLLVQNHVLHRQCLAVALGATRRFADVDLTDNAADALARVRQRPPHVVMADLALPARGALELARTLGDEFAAVRVVILGVDEAPETVRECAAAGAAGYVTSHDTLDQLLTRIEQVLRGELGYSPAVARALFSQLTKASPVNGCAGHADAADAVGALTFRETQVLRLIADGLSNKQIASRLDVSVHTVKNHVHNLLEKLSAKGRTAAARYAYEHHWLVRP